MSSHISMQSALNLSSEIAYNSWQQKWECDSSGFYTRLLLPQVRTKVMVHFQVTGLFVRLHFRFRERKDHRENFCSVEHSLPGSEKYKNFRSMELFLLWNFRSSGANVPRTFVPWNFRTPGTSLLRSECSKNFRSMELSHPSLHKQLSCPLTFAPVKLSLLYTLRNRGIREVDK